MSINYKIVNDGVIYSKRIKCKDESIKQAKMISYYTMNVMSIIHTITKTFNIMDTYFICDMLTSTSSYIVYSKMISIFVYIYNIILTR